MYRIHAQSLLTLAPHVSDDDARPFLHAIMLKADGTATATSGTTLARIHGAHDIAVSVALPAAPLVAAAKAAIKAAGKRNGDTATVSITQNGESWTASAAGQSWTLAESTRFPDVDQVFPEWTDGKRDEPATVYSVSPDLVGLFSRFGKITLYPGREGRAIYVRSMEAPNLEGLIMSYLTRNPRARPNEGFGGSLLPAIND